MQHIILQTSDTSSLTIEPQKTIFWVGAGVGGLPPCNLPLGNGLTDAVMEAALGEHNKKIMIDIWETKIPKIRDGVRNIDHTVLTRHSGIKDKGARPRLEFIIGELHKLDIEFQNIRFQKDFNKVKYQRPSVVKSLQHFSSAAPNIYHYALADFARNGAEIITTNFDICIEKALTGLDTPPAIETPYGIKAIKYGDERFVYHVHGIATDKNIENNLGATLTNVSKSLSKQFTNLLLKCSLSSGQNRKQRGNRKFHVEVFCFFVLSVIWMNSVGVIQPRFFW